MTWLITLVVVAWTALKADRSAHEAELREWEEITGERGE